MEIAGSNSPSPHRRPLVVGLTGGIGSGKSTIADLFRSLGTPVVDADILARQLVEPGEPALSEIRSVFGAGCITPEGRLDRARLRQRVFSNQEAKQKLEAILHPRIRNRISAWITTVNAPYCVVVIPLLLETGQTDLVDRILVVDAPENQQRKRVAARDGLTDNAVMAIMDTQADRETRLAAADDVIDNSERIESLAARVRELHRHYLDLANDN